MSLYPQNSLDLIFSQQGEMLVDLVHEKKWTVPPKVAISAAVCGSFFRRDSNPNQPYSPEEILAEATGAIEAGAAMVHIHVRNSEGWPSSNIKYYHAVLSPLIERFGDSVIRDGCTAFRPFAKTDELLAKKYFEVSPVNCTATFIGNTIIAFSPAHMQAHARALNVAVVRPQMAVYGPGDVDNARRFLIELGIVKPPYFWIVLHGLPGCGLPMHDPIATVEGLAQTVRAIRKVTPEGIIQVCAAGRASSYLAATGMLLGVESIRVGMEDTIYRWPHRDDRIERNSDVVTDMANLARVLGRDIASASEVRQWLHLQAPSVAAV